MSILPRKSRRRGGRRSLLAGVCALGCVVDGPDESSVTGFASATGGGSAGGESPDDGGDGSGDTDPKLDVGGSGDGTPTEPGDPDDPATCAVAAGMATYVGCDFWPTVTYNPVLENFEFATVVANGGEDPAQITVERGGELVASVTVQPGALEAIVLPWVAELKGPQFDAQTTGPRPTESVRVDGGAYHLQSSVPVIAWQFNPLHYNDAVEDCALTQNIGLGATCFSVSNDASLLIPSTALTGNYRLFLKDSVKGTTGGYDDTPAGAAITATEDDTTLVVQLVDTAAVASGPGVPSIAAGATAEFDLDAGDVVQLLGRPGSAWGAPHSDLSGSLVTADRPVQVIGFVPLTSLPSPEVAGEGYADHLEETMLPAEVLGAHYVVAPPTSGAGENIGHYVRFYGNFDGTALSYPGGMPAGAPAVLDAGDVVAFETTDAFEVTGTESFAIGLFVKGGQ